MSRRSLTRRQIDEDEKDHKYVSDRSDRSRSPTFRDESSRRTRSRVRTPVVRRNIVQRTGNNTSILLTPFTFGMEWETSPYYTSAREKHYDRQSIFKSGGKKLIATLEDFKTSNNVPEKITDKQDKDGCKYNLEISVGVLGKEPSISIENFIVNDKIFIPEIETELSDFRENFLDKKKQNLRNFYIREKSENIFPETFGDCSLSIPITEENKMQYPYMYTKNFIYDSGEIKSMEDNIDYISGRPQVTMGLSYALFIPLIMSYQGDKKIDYTLSIYKNIMSNQSIITSLNLLDTNSRFVFLGFALLIIYYCTLSAIYAHKSVSSNYNVEEHLQYFKSIFKLKPRSNLAESYKYLNAEYDHFDEFVNLLYTEVLPSQIPFVFDPSEIDSYSSLVEYHIEYIKSKALDDADIIERLNDNSIYGDDITNKYEDIILFMKSRGYHKYNDIIYAIVIINCIYIIYRILNPKKVVKLRINRDKIGKDCKFLDGYYYSYEEESKNVIDELVSLNYAEIINNTAYDFAHTSDPQILLVDRTRSMDINFICPSSREELFEYIPEDSNLIIEVRNPEHFTENYDSYLDFKDIKNFLIEIFNDIRNVFKDFIQTHILGQQLAHQEPESYKEQEPEPQQEPESSQQEPESSQQEPESLQQEPEPSKEKSQYCNIMFRPKSKNRKTKRNRRK